MEHLPEEILIEIFSHLDNNSMWNAMKVCKSWCKVFSDSSHLMRKFNFVISAAVCENLSHLPSVALRNVTIEKLTVVDENEPSSVHQNQLLNVINTYKSSIEILKLHETQLKSAEMFRNLLISLKNLRHLTLADVIIAIESTCAPLELPDLQSLAITKPKNYLTYFDDTFQLFKNSPMLEKVELSVPEWTSRGFNHQNFSAFLDTLPKFKHLVMHGTGTASYFDKKEFPFKLESLDASLLGFNWTVREPRLVFLRSQLGNLKNLQLGKLPYDFDGGEVLNFIIEEMQLETLHYGDNFLIKDGKKQPVEETWFNEVTISAGMELLRQFPSIKKLRLWLCATGTYGGVMQQIITRNATVFAHLQELKIVDDSGGCHELPKFINLYKSCRNVKKLIIRSDYQSLSEQFKEFLPCMTQLDEFELTCDETDLKKRLKSIRDSCLNLKILKLKSEYVTQAKKVFKRSGVIVESL